MAAIASWFLKGHLKNVVVDVMDMILLRVIRL